MIRIFVAAVIAVVISWTATKLLINWLRDHRVGQPIHEDVPEGHFTKAGTPTMGGLAVVFATILSYGLSGLYRGVYTQRGILVLGAIAGAGFVGFLDDWIKIRDERNIGLNKSAKMVGLLAVAVVFATLSSPRPNSTPS